MSPEHKGTLDNIDYGLSQLLKKGEQEKAIRFLEELLLAHPGKLTLKVFDSAARDIRASGPLISKVLTRWFLRGEPTLCDGVHEICGTHHGGDLHIEIDPAELKPLDLVHVMFIARKAIGYFFMKPVTAASVVISLMRLAPSDEVLHELGELLLNPLLMNYTGSMREYVAKQAGRESGKVKETIDKALASIEKYLEDLRGVPSLPALHPSQAQRESYRRHMAETMAESMRAAEKKSVFFGLFTRSTLLYGQIGGDVQEQVRSSLTGFIAQNTKPNISFQEWNGDKLADVIQSSFLREDLLPEHARSRFRKSLAMLDEPEVSYRHFAELIVSLAAVDTLNDAQRVTAIRQMSICLWILFAWAREAENTESAYRASELTLLHAWNIVKLYAGKDTKTTRAVEAAFFAIFSAYRQISSEFLEKNVLPHADKLHALSSAVYGSCSLDINLKLFDLLGRFGTDGIWAYWGALRCSDEEKELRKASLNETQMYAAAIRSLISNNPVLLLPAKDDQAIDIFIAALLLATDPSSRNFVRSWLAEVIDRARFSYEANGKYPCVLHSYIELLEHPESRDAEYREKVTSASILYPVIEEVDHVQAHCKELGDRLVLYRGHRESKWLLDSTFVRWCKQQVFGIEPWQKIGSGQVPVCPQTISRFC